MLRRTVYNLRRLLGDWRFPLVLLLLFCTVLWDTTSTVRSMSYGRFLASYGEMSPDAVALACGLEGAYDSLDEVWEAFAARLDNAEYYFLCALCNPVLSTLLSGLFLSQWVTGLGIRRRHASELLLRGGTRRAVFFQLFLPALAAVLLVRWGVCLVCLALFPIRWQAFPVGYAVRAVRLWLLLTAAEASVYVFLAFAPHPSSAVAAALVWKIGGSLLPRELRFLPLNVKDLWKVSEGLSELRLAPWGALGVLLAALAGSWLLFRKRDLE